MQNQTEKAEDVLKLRIDAKEENPMYVAKVVKNVKIAESPLWLQNRLMASGIRPHNNVVDITNLCFTGIWSATSCVRL